MKSQASLEYLWVYGFALTVIFITIGFIVSSGITDPSKNIAEKCVVEGVLPCDEFSLDSSDKLVFLVKNRVGLPINITSIEFSNSEGLNCSTLNFNYNNGVIYSPNDFIKFEVDLDSCRASSVFRIDFDITYKIEEPGYFPKSVSGTIVVKDNS